MNGSFSRISVSTKPKTRYELFNGTNEGNFNMGMTLLLQCVKSFMEWIENEQFDKLIEEKERVKKCVIGGPPNDSDKIEQSSINYSSESKE